jgi:hypothetical protein
MFSRARSWLHARSGVRSALFLAENALATVRPRPMGRPAHAPGSERFFLSAMVRVKDEARFLPEWMAYHSVLGVEHFYVYDNSSSDGLAERIAPFIEAGLVTLIGWPQRPISPSADNHFLAHHATDSRWVAFLDADEFIRMHSGDLADLLRANASHPALAINWRYFGSSGFDQLPPGLVIENFTAADATFDRHVKVIAQPRRIRRYRNPHNFLYNGARLARTAGGRRVFASFVTPDPNPQVSLSHYVYRSRSDYARKVMRGYATSRGADDRARREERIEQEFHRHNSVIVAPDEMLIAATRAVLDRLGVDA